MSEKVLGIVLAAYHGKTLVLAHSKYFILKGEKKLGEKIEFKPDDSLPMPSYMFAVAAMNEQDLDAALTYIHTKWYKGH